jgi:hypothetical protein
VTLTAGALVDSNADVTADVDAAVAASATLRLLGYSVRENKGVAAVYSGAIVHGATGAGGVPVVYLEGAADTSATVWFGDSGIACPDGISIDHVAGEFDITLFYKRGER